MTMHPIASKQDWTAARLAFLAKKKPSRALATNSPPRGARSPGRKSKRTMSSRARTGAVSFADLFAGKSQLIVYHFMFGPDWEAGCKSCSFWADNYDRIVVHLKARDTNLVGVSRAPYQRLAAYKKRMGWTFDWVSSLGNSFNHDFAVSFTKDELARPDNNYNFGTQKFSVDEAPGISVFARDGGAIYRTYSTYSRGLDMLNGAYHLLDLVPKGRDEEGLSYGMEWLRRRDEYGTSA